MRSTGGLWGSVGTYTWRGDTCHVPHDTCHESSDRSDEWVDIDSGKRSTIFSFWHWPRERNCWVLNTMWCRDDRWPGPLHQCAVLTFDWSMLVILSSDWSLCNGDQWSTAPGDEKFTINYPDHWVDPGPIARSLLCLSEINFPLTRPREETVWARCLVSAPCHHDGLTWHSSVLCWEEICSLKIFKIFSLNTQNKHHQGALCCLLSGSVCAVATAQPWESKCWTFILTLTISHFTITQLFAAYIFVNWFCYSQNALYHQLENIQMHLVSKICGSQIPMRGFYVRKDHGVKPCMMQSNKSDKQLLPSEETIWDFSW